MHTTSRSFLFCALFLAAPLAAVACSDGTPNPNTPPQATGETTTAAAEPTSIPSAVPTAEPTAAPEASGTATAAVTAAPDKPKPSGRPPVLLADPKSITDTFGFSPGARLELGDKNVATLRIPEGAFTQATNVTFALDAKCQTTGLVIGAVIKITPTIPPATTPGAVASNNGSPFVLLMPNNKKKDLNLAIGNYGKDAKGKEAMIWKIVAAAKSDDTTAEFHLDTLPDGCVHLTTKAVN